MVRRMGDVELPRYSVVPPVRGMVGDIRAAVLYAGTGVARIGDLRSASEVVADLTKLL